jgi:integrase
VRIYKQKGSKNWYLETGRGKAKSLRTTDEEVANRALERAILDRALREEQGIKESSRPTLSGFAKRYTSRPIGSPKSKAADALALKLFQQSAGDITIDRVDPDRIQKFVEDCQARGCKTVSINSYLRHLRASLRWAEDRYRGYRAPKVKLLKVGRHLPRALSRDQVATLLKKCWETDPDFLPYLIFYLYCGLRRAELLSLQWSDLNLEQGLMLVRGKGGKERQVPLMAPVLQMLRSLPREGEYIFPRQHADGITHRFQALARTCQISCRLHDLRHTYGTHLLAGGAPLEVVQVAMGHQAIGTTQIYATVVAESLKKVSLDYGVQIVADRQRQLPETE